MGLSSWVFLLLIRPGSSSVQLATHVEVRCLGFALLPGVARMTWFGITGNCCDSQASSS